MTGTMSLADLAQDLRASIHDAADVFVNSDDMARLLRVAAQAFNRHRPRTLVGSLMVEAGRSSYPAPDDIYLYKSGLWGVTPQPKFWDRNWPGPAPDVRLVDVAQDVAPEGAGNGKQLLFSFAPTQRHIAAFGSECRYYYLACHQLSDSANGTTISAGDRALLVLRAQVEAMRELSMRNSKKPVQLRDGLHSGPKNMTPSALYEKLLQEWESNVKGLAL